MRDPLPALWRYIRHITLNKFTGNVQWCQLQSPCCKLDPQNYGYINSIISFGMWTWGIFTLICILFHIFSSMLYIFQHTALSLPWLNLVLSILLFSMLLQIRLFFFLIVHCFYIEAQLIVYPDILLHSYISSNTRKPRWSWQWQ